MGSSDQLAFVNAGAENRCYLLYHARGKGEVTVNGTAIEPHAFVNGRAPAAPARGRVRLRPRVRARQGLRGHVRLREPVHAARSRSQVNDTRHPPRRLRREPVRLALPAGRRRDRPAATPSVRASRSPITRGIPVLLIGSFKAELYTRALIGDVVHKRHNLADPGWLVRVGLYLELLTVLGIFAAAGDQLTAEERAIADGWDDLRLNVEGWERVWELRHADFGQPRLGPVGARNLLNKRRATLEFLHVHHEDLQRAIELAGPNHTHAQETWHRVFRDAERAVLWQSKGAFPELELPAAGGAAVRALAPARAPRAQAGAAGARADAAPVRRSGRAVRVGLQRVPGVDEPRRGLGQRPGPDGPHGRGGDPAPGEPARGAHEPAVAGRAAAGGATATTRASR